MTRVKLDLRRNIGPYDRLFRVILGLALISLAFARPWSLPLFAVWTLYLAGLVQIIQGASGY